VRVLYPKPGHNDDILSAVKKVSEAARLLEGLVEIGAWMDKEGDRIVNISLWESREQAVRRMRCIGGSRIFPGATGNESRRKTSLVSPGLSEVLEAQRGEGTFDPYLVHAARRILRD